MKTKKKNQVWHHEAWVVGAVAFAFAFFATQGLPLWDDDYHQWLRQAGDGFFTLLGRILLPFTSQPETWGYSDRPLLVLLYKLLHGVVGVWGTGFYFVKSLAFGALCAVVWKWLRDREGLDRLAAGLVVGLFAVCVNVTASMVMLSDFGVASQAALVAIFAWSWRQMNSPARTAEPRDWLRFHLIFFASVYFASKLKGDVRIAPLVLLAWLAIYRKTWLKVHALPFALTFLATLPWSKGFFSKLPPFIPGATGYTGFTFSPFSMSRAFEFLVGDFFKLGHPALSVAGALGLFVVIGLAAYAGWRASKDRLDQPGAETGFLLVWLGVAVLACGAIGRQNHIFQLRYTLIPLVPAILLLGRFVSIATRDLAKQQIKWQGHSWAWFRPAMCALFAVQLFFHLQLSYAHRRDMGRARVATDQAFREIDAKHANAQFVHLPGFLEYGYRGDASPALRGRRSLAKAEDIRKEPIGTIAAGWSPMLWSDLTYVGMGKSCNGSLFDLIAPCGPTDGIFIYKHIGHPPELGEAEQLSAQGKLAEAGATIDAYLQREPGNHGAKFTRSILAYREKDFARMESLYDEIGPYYPSNTAVLYNWGLAKQGVKKFDESYRILERAYSMLPNDYGVGFNLAASYFDAGKKSRALATLGTLMKHYPKDVTMKNVYEQWSKK